MTLIDNGIAGPRDGCGNGEAFEDVIKDRPGTQSTNLSLDHLADTIGYVSDALSMPFTLPKSCLDVRAVRYSSRNINLIEWCVDWYSNDFSTSLPEGLLCCVKVLTDSIGAGIPESNSLHQRIANSIVGYWENNVQAGAHVREMSEAMRMIVDTDKYWYIQVVAGEDLWWYEDARMLRLQVMIKVLFNLIDIEWRHP